MKEDLGEIERRLDTLPQGLKEHSERTSRLCFDLANRFGCDPEKARLAGLAHDIARAMSSEELISRAMDYNLEIGPIEGRVPVLLHGLVGAEILRRELGITDVEILGAVRCHSTGRGGMSLLDKVVFIGDKLDPGRNEAHPAIERIRELSKENLDQALLEFFNRQIASLAESGRLIHPATVEARNEFLL